jgi:hypothetical protein
MPVLLARITRKDLQTDKTKKKVCIIITVIIVQNTNSKVRL